MMMTFRGVELKVCFTHHPEQLQNLETEPIDEHVKIESIQWMGLDISTLFREWQDEEELAADVLNQLKEERYEGRK